MMPEGSPIGLVVKLYLRHHTSRLSREREGGLLGEAPLTG